MRHSTVQLFVLHFVANALLLWLGYYWLGLGESSGLHLAWSAAVVAFLICAGVWLHGTALVYFDLESSLSIAARAALRNVMPLLAIALCVMVIYGLLSWVQSHFVHWGFVTGSFLTMRIRKPVRPATIVQAMNLLLWLMRWLVVPVLALPLAAGAAVGGWDGFRKSFHHQGVRWIYWIEVCVLLVLAVSAPLKLMAWVPEVHGFSWQMISFVSRLFAGYLLFVAALLALAFFTSGGKPRLIQESTVVSP
jgi:hypothetical protein